MVRIIDKGPRVQATYDRITEIAKFLKRSQHPDPMIESSALLGTSAIILAAANGIEPTRENRQRILRLIISKIGPALEEELSKMAK